MSAHKKKPDFSVLIVIPFFIVMILLVGGIRLAITGGDWGCVFAEDPALCVAVKGVGE